MSSQSDRAPRPPRSLSAVRLSARFALLLSVCLGLTGVATLAQAQSDTLRIGVIGTGNIGGTLARYWARAGHELVISSRHPEELAALADELGPRVSAAEPRVAAAFGDVVLVAVPYGAIPQIGRDYAAELAGKVVIDTGNPFEFRDGDVAVEAREEGSGIVSARYLGDVRLVRAFNTIGANTLRSASNRSPERLGVPIAGNDADALAVAERLVRDAGFDPVTIGRLEDAKIFDVDQPLYREDLTAAELRSLKDSLARCWPWVAAVSTRLCAWFF